MVRAGTRQTPKESKGQVLAQKILNGLNPLPTLTSRFAYWHGHLDICALALEVIGPAIFLLYIIAMAAGVLISYRQISPMPDPRYDLGLPVTIVRNNVVPLVGR